MVLPQLHLLKGVLPLNVEFWHGYKGAYADIADFCTERGMIGTSITVFILILLVKNIKTLKTHVLVKRKILMKIIRSVQSG